jgi:hypothetical protein
MIRTLTASAILGALIAGVGVYTINSPLWQTATASPSNWPICTRTVATWNVEAKYDALRKEYAKLRSAFAAAGSPAVVQVYGLGHAPTAEEISAANIQN